MKTTEEKQLERGGKIKKLLDKIYFLENLIEQPINNDHE